MNKISLILKESNNLLEYKVKIDKDKKLAEKLANSCNDVNMLHKYIQSEYDKIDKLNKQLNDFNNSTELQKLNIIKKYNKNVSSSKQIKSIFGYSIMINDKINSHTGIISIYDNKISYLLFPAK